MNKLNDQFNFCLSHKCGNSSVVEHYLAKVRVAGSNPVSRSIKIKGLLGLQFLHCILQIVFPQNCKQNSPLLQRLFLNIAIKKIA